MSRRRPWEIILVVLIVLSAPVGSGAQAPAQAALTALFPDTTVDSAVAQEIERARGRGVPAEPLLAKVREGRLKRATTGRIRIAVSALATRLDTARAALGPAASLEELVAGAEALAVGADASSVRAVRAASFGRTMSAPLGALAQLVASGVPVARAVTMIVDLMRRNATPAQVVAFGSWVESDAARGLPAEEAARFRWREFGASSGHANTLGADAATTLPGSVTQSPGSSSPSTTTPRRRP